MYSNQIASYNGGYEFTRFGRTLTAVPIVDRSSPLSFPHSKKILPKQSAVNTSSSEIPSMSLPFREVYSEYTNTMKENAQSNSNNTHHHVNGLIGDRLLYSSDNSRPKSRARTNLYKDKDVAEKRLSPVASKDIPKLFSPLNTLDGSNNAQDFSSASDKSKKGLFTFFSLYYPVYLFNMYKSRHRLVVFYM